MNGSIWVLSENIQIYAVNKDFIEVFDVICS